MTLTFKSGNSDTVIPLQFRLKKQRRKRVKSNNLLHNMHTMYRNAVELIPEKEMTNYSSCSSSATNGPSYLRDMEID